MALAGLTKMDKYTEKRFSRLSLSRKADATRKRFFSPTKLIDNLFEALMQSRQVGKGRKFLLYIFCCEKMFRKLFVQQTIERQQIEKKFCWKEP